MFVVVATALILHLLSATYTGVVLTGIAPQRHAPSHGSWRKIHLRMGSIDQNI